MRGLTDKAKLSEFMRTLGAVSRESARVYFTGGVSAVLMGWRDSTIDIDLAMEPEQDDLLRSFPELKERLHVNVELVWPPHFLPELPGWRERSPFIAREGELSFHHFDFYSQALSKIERAHTKDLEDVRAMRSMGLIDSAELRRLHDAIVPNLYRYPAVDPPSLRKSLEAALSTP
jgi:hypothetical protein